MTVYKEYEQIARAGEKAFLLQLIADLPVKRQEKLTGKKIGYKNDPYHKSDEGKRQHVRNLATMERFYAAQMEKPEHERVSFFN